VREQHDVTLLAHNHARRCLVSELGVKPEVQLGKNALDFGRVTGHLRNYAADTGGPAWRVTFNG